MKFKDGDKVKVIKEIDLQNRIDSRRFIIGEIGYLHNYSNEFFIFKAKSGNYIIVKDCCEEYFEKIENKSMKFEEVLPEYRDGAEIEWFCDRDNRWIDMPRPGQYREFSIGFLMNGNFRIKPKKEKVKKYQFLYSKDLDGKPYFLTSKLKYIDAKDFWQQNKQDSLIFHSIILESEEEFDE